MKTQVSIEEVCELEDRRAFINSLNLDEIEWTIKGVPVQCDRKVIENFRFMGLGNINFITMDIYKEQSDD